MQLEVNGQPKPLPWPLSVAELLDALDLNAQHIAVEVNRELVPRTGHRDHILADGDRVEIVTLVGGG